MKAIEQGHKVRRLRSVCIGILALAAAMGSTCATRAQVPTQPFAGAWEEKNVDAVCKAAKAVPLSMPVPAGPLTPAQLPACDEVKLYFGLGDAPNYPAALQCGLYQRARPDETRGDIFQGPGVLSMLYANGQGVPQNFNLAIRFACENSWSAPAAQAYEVGDLEHRRTDPAARAKPFNLCDDETSGLAEGNCTEVQTSTADTARNQKLAALVKALPPAAQADFPALARAQKAFAEARSGNEVDLSGTGRAAFALDEEARLNDQFLQDLRRFTTETGSAAERAEFPALDAALNAAYRHLQTVPADHWEDGTIKPAGIQATERVWLSLVDAYVHFVGLANPKLDPVDVKVQLWKLRLHQLKGL